MLEIKFCFRFSCLLKEHHFRVELVEPTEVTELSNCLNRYLKLT